MYRIIRESDIRENEFIQIIGTNGTGKTAKLKELLKKWKEYNTGITMGFDPHHELSDELDITINPTESNWREQVLRLRDGIIVIDDFKVLHPKNITESWLLNLMQFRRAWNVDIIMVTHSPSLVLTTMCYYITKYYIFYTETTLGSWKKKIPNYTQCQAASLYINKYVSIKGKGKYPDFPFMIVDNKTRKVTGVNIKR